MAHYAMHTTGVFHYKGQAWSRQLPGSSGHHRFSTFSTVELQTLLVEFIPMVSAMITWLPWLYNARTPTRKVEDNSYNRTDNRSVELYKEHIILSSWGLNDPSCPCTAMLLVMASKVIALTFLLTTICCWSCWPTSYFLCIVAIHWRVTNNAIRQWNEISTIMLIKR